MDGAEMLLWHERGETFGQIAKRLGVTRNVVAGAIHRARHGKKAWLNAKFRRDLSIVRQNVALADEIGLVAAAKKLGMGKANLCRDRQRIRAMDAA